MIDRQTDSSFGETTTTTNSPEPPAEFESKESLVLSIALPDETDGEGGSSESGNGRFHISPREGLTVAFRAAVETIEGQQLQATALGILITTFTLAGVERSGWSRRRESEDQAITGADR